MEGDSRQESPSRQKPKAIKSSGHSASPLRSNSSSRNSSGSKLGEKKKPRQQKDEKKEEDQKQPEPEPVPEPKLIPAPAPSEKENEMTSAEQVENLPISVRIITFLRGIKPIYYAAYFLIIVVTVLLTLYIEMKNEQREWHLLTGYGSICLFLAIGDGSPRQFFRPMDETNTEGRKCFAFWMLTMTSFVSWVMAKSIQNSAKLGARYGLVGGLAYAAWFIGVFTTGVIVYFLRKQGYYSLPDFINDRYGPLACTVFALTVLYRLFNEVWSNTIVIADFFGASLSFNWKLAAWASMAIPASYTFIGGMRASLYSDALQAILMCVLLLMTYFHITKSINDNDELKLYLKDTNNSDSLWKYNPEKGREMYSLEGGLDLLYTGLLQGALSYTFMDPALTDRSFLASKEVMIFAFGLGSLLAMAYITVFGFIGVYGNMLGDCVSAGTCANSDLNGADVDSVSAGEPSAVGTALGGAYYTLLCLVIITSALSTLDSTFSAVAKVAGPDLHGFLTNGRPINPSDSTSQDVLIGRIAILVIGITGTLPLLYDPDELDATTVTGTMVPGLGPPIYMAAFGCLLGAKFSGRITTRTRPLLFLLPFCFSASLGTVYQLAKQDKNCTPFEVMNCEVPSWSNTTSDACTDYATYYTCRYASGCWRNDDMNDCLKIETVLEKYQGTSCDLGCHDERNSRKQRFETIVDLNGFNIGNGAYKNLFGVNVVSAIGALFLFLFACSDDFLTEKFDEIKNKPSEAELMEISPQSEKYNGESETRL
jgi:Na+/proline symporter